MQSGPIAEHLETGLFEKGFETLVVRMDELSQPALPAVVSALWSAGVVTIYAGELTALERDAIRAFARDRFFEFPRTQSPEKVAHQALDVAETLRIGGNFTDKKVLDRI